MRPEPRVLTWRKACRESFRRTATAAMATAPGARGRRRGTAEAWRRRGEGEELPASLRFASPPLPLRSPRLRACATPPRRAISAARLPAPGSPPRI